MPIARDMSEERSHAHRAGHERREKPCPSRRTHTKERSYAHCAGHERRETRSHVQRAGHERGEEERGDNVDAKGREW